MGGNQWGNHEGRNKLSIFVGRDPVGSQRVPLNTGSQIGGRDPNGGNSGVASGNYTEALVRVKTRRGIRVPKLGVTTPVGGNQWGNGRELDRSACVSKNEAWNTCSQTWGHDPHGGGGNQWGNHLLLLLLVVEVAQEEVGRRRRRIARTGRGAVAARRRPFGADRPENGVVVLF